MIEVPIIYGKSTDGEKWIEYVCESKEEADEKIAFLKKKQVVVPEAGDQIWDTLGLGFIERELIIKYLRDFERRECNDKPWFTLEYDYINDIPEHEQTDLKESIRLKVIKVSEMNSKGNYIHWLVRTDEDEPDSRKIVYKISLPEAASIGKVDTLNLSEFKIVTRPSGFVYSDKTGVKRIVHSENWLFVKHPRE